jgi:hypothetical protein
VPATQLRFGRLCAAPLTATLGVSDDGTAVTSYPATLRHIPALARVFGLLGILAVAAPIAAGSYHVAALCITAIGVASWRFSGMRLTFEDRALQYRGWVTECEFLHEDILTVTRAAAKGWPHDRIYGWSVFEVATERERARINLLWFGPAASRAFHEQFKC